MEKKIAKDWEYLYGVQVCDETFVIEERLWNGKTRMVLVIVQIIGNCLVSPKGMNETNVRGREHQDKRLKQKKLIYAKRIPGRNFVLTTALPGMTGKNERTKPEEGYVP